MPDVRGTVERWRVYRDYRYGWVAALGLGWPKEFATWREAFVYADMWARYAELERRYKEGRL